MTPAFYCVDEQREEEVVITPIIIRCRVTILPPHYHYADYVTHMFICRDVSLFADAIVYFHYAFSHFTLDYHHSSITLRHCLASLYFIISAIISSHYFSMPIRQHYTPCSCYAYHERCDARPARLCERGERRRWHGNVRSWRKRRRRRESRENGAALRRDELSLRETNVVPAPRVVTFAAVRVDKDATALW